MSREITRRDAMKTALKMGTYAVPAIIATTVPRGVAAATPAPSADLGIFSSASPPSATLHVGDTITFTLTAGNSGPSPATGVRAVDFLTPNDPPFTATFTFVSATASQGTYAPPAGGFYTGAGFGNSVGGTWNIGTLAVGQSVTLAISARLTATTTANAATYASNVSGSQTDPVFGNNLTTQQFNIAP